ncbi:MAG: efflux RND transporter periplasmic adaptor subunit [Treponema sp.]|jgi:multidrug efflux pump subunit AcrA (membrane-fusion protein)|nr:efflux RND transporter periplasmic adaptor subunit [Treponema sp.]
MRKVITVVLVVLMAVLNGCNREKAAVSNPETVQDVPIFAVNTTTAVRGQIQDYLTVSGDIVAGSTVDVYPEVAGKITQLSSRVGSRVSKGAAIAQVDPSRPGMQYIVSTVRAPIDGTIITLPAQIGMTVSPQLSIARIAGGNGLELSVYVAERFISKISVGLPCTVHLDAYPSEIFRGIVTEVSPTVDPASRTMDVRINVDNPESRLKSGMFAKVNIITEQKENIVKIPVTALVSRFGEDYIFTVEAEGNYFVARKRVIQPGILIDGVLEVQNGLQAGEEIIIRGQSLLSDGSRINIIERVSALSTK